MATPAKKTGSNDKFMGEYKVVEEGPKDPTREAGELKKPGYNEILKKKGK